MMVGDRIVRKTTQASGYILQASRMPSGTYMVRIQWDADGSTQWLPSEEVRPWDKLKPPPPSEPVVPRRWLKTPVSEKRRKEFAANKLADKLAGLSDRRKNRTKNKAKKLIAKFNAPPVKLERPAWNYAISPAEEERKAMKKLYQEKSGDHSY